MTVPLAVTVTAKQPGRYVDEARTRAAEWGLPFVARPRRSALQPALDAVATAFLVLGGNGWTLRDAERELRFSPGMAMLRVKRIDAGHVDDVLVRLAELRSGDVVVDATLGLAADALVCARAVGPTGLVIGVEAALPLYALAREGLARMAPFAGSARIEVRHGLALAALGAMPTASADVVLLDPMFDVPKRATPAFEVLRRFALHEPLDAQTLAEARRVCRRWVVVKGGRYGRALPALGLTQARTSPSSPAVWARVGPVP